MLFTTSHNNRTSPPRVAIEVPMNGSRGDAAASMRACARLARAEGWQIVAMFPGAQPVNGAVELQRHGGIQRLRSGEFDILLAPTLSSGTLAVRSPRDRR